MMTRKGNILLGKGKSDFCGDGTYHKNLGKRQQNIQLEK